MPTGGKYWFTDETCFVIVSLLKSFDSLPRKRFSHRSSQLSQLIPRLLDAKNVEAVFAKSLSVLPHGYWMQKNVQAVFAIT